MFTYKLDFDFGQKQGSCILKVEYRWEVDVTWDSWRYPGEQWNVIPQKKPGTAEYWFANI